MVDKLRSPARQFIAYSDKLYVLLEDGSMWAYDGKGWELIAECPLTLLADAIEELGKY